MTLEEVVAFVPAAVLVCCLLFLVGDLGVFLWRLYYPPEDPR